MAVAVTEWTEFLQGFAAFIGAVCAVLVATNTKKKAPSDPPVERAPTPHEMRELIAAIRDRMERHHELTQDDLSEIKKALDRIEASNRLQDALAGIRREMGK